GGPSRHATSRAASMGPSTLIDGDATRPNRRRVCCIWLQWGRRLSSTETRTGSGQHGETVASMGPSTLIDGDTGVIKAYDLDGEVLQWGRRLSSTETGAWISAPGRYLSFNGAVDSHRRRLLFSRMVGPCRRSFNGAVDSHRRRPAIPVSPWRPRRRLQWGRRLS